MALKSDEAIKRAKKKKLVILNKILFEGIVCEHAEWFDYMENLAVIINTQNNSDCAMAN